MAIRHYIDFTNTHPKPFIWTKTADEILASVAGPGGRAGDVARIVAELVSAISNSGR